MAGSYLTVWYVGMRGGCGYSWNMSYLSDWNNVWWYVCSTNEWTKRSNQLQRLQYEYGLHFQSIYNLEHCVYNFWVCIIMEVSLSKSAYLDEHSSVGRKCYSLLVGCLLSLWSLLLTVTHHLLEQLAFGFVIKGVGLAIEKLPTNKRFVGWLVQLQTLRTSTSNMYLAS